MPNILMLAPTAKSFLSRNMHENPTFRSPNSLTCQYHPDYSVYNFRNKKQEDDFEENGTLPSETPSIYNEKAVDFIVSVLKAEK